MLFEQETLSHKPAEGLTNLLHIAVDGLLQQAPPGYALQIVGPVGMEQEVS